MLPRQRGEVDGADDVSVQPGGELRGLRVEGPPAGRRHVVLGEHHLDRAVVALAPDPDDAAVHPGGRPAVAVGVEDLARRGAEVEAALLPAHRRRVERRQQRRPRPGVGDRLDVVGQDPADGAAVEGHRDRLDVGERTTHGRLGGARATRPGRPRCRGRRTCSQAATRAAYPSCSGSGVRHCPQPLAGGGPARARELPAAVVLTAQDRSGGGQGDDHRRRHRDVCLVGPLAARDPGVEGRQRAAHLRGRQRTVVLDQPRAPARGAPRPRPRRRGRCRRPPSPWPSAAAAGRRPARSHSPRPRAAARAGRRRRCAASRAA